MQQPRKIHLPTIQQDVVLVDREQLRAHKGVRQMHCPGEVNFRKPLPEVPATWDVSQGGAIDYPVMGNDRYGNCYYVAVAKAALTTSKDSGIDWTPDVQKLIDRYLEVAGGDVGMYDEQVIAEWKGGLIGPSGPRKLVNRMLVNPSDAEGHSLAGYLFGGNIYTASLADAWLQHIQAGAVWDDGRNVRPNPGNGHAMIQTGKDKSGRWVTQTWGLKPPVFVTQAGLLKCDPEVWTYWTEDWVKGGKSPNGHTREDLRQWWIALGGEDPGPGTDPGPGPAPGPGPSPGGVTGTLQFPGAVVTLPPTTLPITLQLPASAGGGKGWSIADLIAGLEALLAILQAFQSSGGQVPQSPGQNQTAGR